MYASLMTIVSNLQNKVFNFNLIFAQLLFTQINMMAIKIFNFFLMFKSEMYNSCMAIIKKFQKYAMNITFMTNKPLHIYQHLFIITSLIQNYLD
jgi:hypothetical protein